MVIIAFVVVQILLATGSMTSLMKGLLVPLCVYAILAVSLNLTVGILGELSLGHAGFMCIGAFTGAFFSKCVQEVITIGWLRISIAIILGSAMAGLFGFLIGMPVLRLKGDYLAIVTLGFGEIIKTVVNVVYIGRDENGFHFSIKSNMEKNQTVRLIGEINQLDYDYYKIEVEDETGNVQTGFIPKSYITFFDGSPKPSETHTYGECAPSEDSIWRLTYLLLGAAAICVLLDLLILQRKPKDE